MPCLRTCSNCFFGLGISLLESQGVRIFFCLHVQTDVSTVIQHHVDGLDSSDCPLLYMTLCYPVSPFCLLCVSFSFLFPLYVKIFIYHAYTIKRFLFYSFLKGKAIIFPSCIAASVKTKARYLLTFFGCYSNA